ncbi:hypothetical protein A3G67_02785 [Candidatus Roizmanbacteria bacterium RIFCSPLOWO2_12_FULL_40_12]|nr:MAG: hypothetical protein A2779_00315 [Candidatus Roizmanbacteria bacterium RIFCSPHIGHO2_01_FULL_40_98]OGK27503.1 MAG: hypothetical protein A3C31_03470 [Candidatus Roizmanbacteria bacterium RIFCSPHIGHO2_02_FULL_40_53]OGK59273.1 MAG: hypothetical protein A3H84_04805 [Candidatus Roizmanbacteria bacterium RIFCSPLOWO2_02_FULL_40_13]OGK60535.1 MAG: hypothetical protein A3G67_02785 [Candidatus Roizmanbacteria bacterium RIFCSPLOWO2_12_FULL_40_12]
MIGRISLKKSTFPQNSEVLVLPVAEGDLAILKKLDPKAAKSLQDKIKKFDFKGKAGEALSTENVGSHKRLVLLGTGKKEKLTSIIFREKLADVIRRLRDEKAYSMELYLADLLLTEEAGKNIGLALHLSNYSFIKYRGEKTKKQHHEVKELTVFVPLGASADAVKKFETGLTLAEALAEGIYLSRDLVNEPASHVGASELVDAAKAIEKESKGNIKVEVLEEAECRKLGMGSYLGVAQGSEQKPKFIVIRAKTSAGAKKKICIIGKSIVFDTGGLSLKPPKAMMDMKFDMAGGAAVLGFFKVLTRDPALFSELSKKAEIVGILPACENMPSGKAMRPGDIVTALNGKTIEALNTDAEGRMTLADALSYAEKHLKSDYIVDLATLTGACIVALGEDLAGLFANDKEFGKLFREAADTTGEGIWPLPLYKPYLKGMKNGIADLKNIRGSGYGGAITGALFLSEFVEKAKWIHVDISGPAFREQGPVGILPRGATGWGVLTLIEFLKRIVN